MLNKNRSLCRKFLPLLALLSGFAVTFPATSRADDDAGAKSDATLLDTLNWLRGKLEKELPIQNPEATSQKVDVNWGDDMRVMTIKIQPYKDANKSRPFSYRDTYEIQLSRVSLEEMKNKRDDDKKGVYLTPLRYRRVDERDAEVNSTLPDGSVTFVFETETMATRVTNAFIHAIEVAKAHREAEDAKPPNEPF